MQFDIEKTRIIFLASQPNIVSASAYFGTTPTGMRPEFAEQDSMFTLLWPLEKSIQQLI